MFIINSGHTVVLYNMGWKRDREKGVYIFNLCLVKSML